MNPRLASIVWGKDGMQVRALSRRGSGQRELLLVVVTLLASGHFRWGVCLSPVARTWPALSVCLLRTVLMFPSWHPGPLQGSAILRFVGSVPHLGERRRPATCSTVDIGILGFRGLC